VNLIEAMEWCRNNPNRVVENINEGLTLTYSADSFDIESEFDSFKGEVIYLPLRDWELKELSTLIELFPKFLSGKEIFCIDNGEELHLNSRLQLYNVEGNTFVSFYTKTEVFQEMANQKIWYER
jgi:hypothetical protein